MATTNGSFSQQEQYRGSTESYPATSGAAETSGGSGNGSADLSKDEIGWYFVEQYYTTLSKSPEKLHLFYGKRSQLVSGPEAEAAPVSVGRSAIQERFKSLDFQECKVRVSNVDSQGSGENIVIQVIGEMSNKSVEPKKFVQTFVLAQQPTGYFVLNDIFRYINEDLEEEIQAIEGHQDIAQPTNHEQLAEGVEMPKAQPATEDQPQGDLDADVIEKKLEETAEADPAALTDGPTSNGGSAVETPEVEIAGEAPVATTQVEDQVPDTKAIEKAVEDEDTQESEKPKDPAPSSAVPSKPTSAAPPQPAIPAKPMSWANRVAATAAVNAPRPAVPNPKTASPVPTQNRVPPTTQATPVATAPQSTQTFQPVPAAGGNKENEAPQQAQGSGWQTAGSDHAKRQNRPQSVSGPLEKEGTMGYVRNVTESVKADELRSALSSHGELVYFDINRQKNCAFVEFATTAGYLAAAAANPHMIGGESIIVEPRRPKASAYGGSGYSNQRGSLNNSRGGRGGFDQPRGGNQRGRGDFAPNRGRGAPRGRATGPATPA